ncbi:MAG: hypothetical protein NTV49_08960, partial [Kiritimatiellaeota bacterium]|nr:hypothetical protein [Kiritimatiellota bacterium]
CQDHRPTAFRTGQIFDSWLPSEAIVFFHHCITNAVTCVYNECCHLAHYPFRSAGQTVETGCAFFALCERRIA